MQVMTCPRCGYKPLKDISPREQQVLDLLYTGMTNREASKKLFLSSKTITTYMSRAKLKLGVSTIMGAYQKQNGV